MKVADGLWPTLHAINSEHYSSTALLCNHTQSSNSFFLQHPPYPAHHQALNTTELELLEHAGAAAD